jgi:hypothetical protein
MGVDVHLALKLDSTHVTCSKGKQGNNRLCVV